MFNYLIASGCGIYWKSGNMDCLLIKDSFEMSDYVLARACNFGHIFMTVEQFIKYLFVAGVHLRFFVIIRFLFSFSVGQRTHRQREWALGRGVILREQSEAGAGTGPEIQYRT